MVATGILANAVRRLDDVVAHHVLASGGMSASSMTTVEDELNRARADARVDA
jgi:hypothetical protein